MVDRQERADALVRATLSLGDGDLRARYVASIVHSSPLDALAQALDTICERAEQAEAASREALFAIVDALNGDGMDDVIQRLREEAAGASLLALERLIRAPARSRSPSSLPPRDRSLSDEREGRGRVVPLGQRKSLARRPDREMLERLLRDPHPDVIRRCMTNPRLVEDDVVRLAARRPGHPEALAAIARSRWVHRPRVRISLVMNPATPLEVVVRLVGLLLRPELTMAAHSPGVAASVRALCLEHLVRRPPVDEAEPSKPDLQ
ncbi:MAG TPA: hypothetical protein VHV30_13890 [Polyangiaceae bacterium]|nr:hypothetical protein [Polyangiaceae bacterium]